MALMTRGKLWREAPIALVGAVLFYIGLSSCLRSSEVLGESMGPGLHDGERLFINRLAYRFGEDPQRGDVIVFAPPAELGSPFDYIKRIIGLPGERVEVKSGWVYIHQPNGQVLRLEESSYLAEPPMQYYMSSVIPEGQYFVMGDNRNISEDSHNGWTVPLASIVGRAWVVVWPPTEWGSAPNCCPPSD